MEILLRFLVLIWMYISRQLSVGDSELVRSRIGEVLYVSMKLARKSLVQLIVLIVTILFRALRIVEKSYNNNHISEIVIVCVMQ